MSFLRIISRVIPGVVFIFSGFVKAIDPLGSVYKFGDYFTAAGLEFMQPIALPLSILLSSSELTIGVALLIAYRMNFFSWAVLVFMSFFTILTLFIAIYNPVTDCGCFGDAFIISNWATFWKNVVLLALVVFLFLNRNRFKRLGSVFGEWLVTAIVFTAITWLSVYALNYLPPMDFRPYSIGSNIPLKIYIPPDAPVDEYETRLIYRNKLTGSEEEFSIENFPRDTSLYEFVDASSILIRKGYEPPIQNFAVNSLNGEDVTDFLIRNEAYTFLLISYDLNIAGEKGLKKAELLARFAHQVEGVNFYGISASAAQTINEVREEMNLSFEIYQADEITLKTIVRANPGLILLKNGTIIGKWHYNDFPSPGNEFHLFDQIAFSYPFYPGTRLRSFDIPPPGAGSDQYETILYYQNNFTDSVFSFTVDNFPRTPEWTFVDSKTKLLRKGYLHPLQNFQPVNAEGRNLGNELLRSADNLLIALVNDPALIEPDLLTRINSLSVLAADPAEGNFRTYLLTSLENEEINNLDENFLPAVTIGRLSEDYISRIAEDGIALVLIKDGVVRKLVKNSDIPESMYLHDFLTYMPEELKADDLILTSLMESFRRKWEKRFVYISVFSLVLFGLFLRIYFEGRKKEPL